MYSWNNICNYFRIITNNLVWNVTNNFKNFHNKKCYNILEIAADNFKCLGVITGFNIQTETKA